jgi:predicted RNA-binding protein with PUA-like domain
MSYWLFKTEPDDYSYADLARDQHVVWEGVRNPTALGHLGRVEKGDRVAFYHTGKEKAVVGLAEVTRGAYPDPKLGNPKRVVVDLKPVRALKAPVPLADFRIDPILKTTELVRISRLSVMPLSKAHFARVLERAGEKP